MAIDITLAGCILLYVNIILAIQYRSCSLGEMEIFFISPSTLSTTAYTDLLCFVLFCSTDIMFCYVLFHR